MRPHVSAVLFLSMLVSTLSAQVLKLNRGDMEIAFHGQFDPGVTAINLRFGTFAADYLQIGTNVDYQDSNFAERMAFNLYVIRLLETRRYILPYVGASLGYGSLDITGGRSESGAELQVLTGIKYYLADNVSLNTELHFGASSGRTYLGDRKITSNEVGLRIGLAYLW